MFQPSVFEACNQRYQGAISCDQNGYQTFGIGFQDVFVSSLLQMSCGEFSANRNRKRAVIKLIRAFGTNLFVVKRCGVLASAKSVITPLHPLLVRLQPVLGTLKNRNRLKPELPRRLLDSRRNSYSTDEPGTPGNSPGTPGENCFD